MGANKAGKQEKSKKSDEVVGEIQQKGYRPEKEILDLFYSLPELDKTKRHNGIVSLLANLKSDPLALDYCVERLVIGLASFRAAARIGFSTTLCILLETVGKQWTVERFFDLADKKMSLQDEDSKNAHAIAHHLLATSLINSQQYKNSYMQILERELSLYRKFPFMAMTIFHSIGDLLLSTDSKTFRTSYLASLKEYFECALQKSLPEVLHLIFIIRNKHLSVISEQVSFIQKDGRCQFSDEDLEYLLTTLKKCDKNVINVFINQILDAARSGKQFDIVYKTIVERWACSGDETKVLERIFSTAEMALRSGTDYMEVISIFSDVLMKRITNIMIGKHTTQQKILRTKINLFCERINEKLAVIEDSSVLLQIIAHLDKNGSFDLLTGCKVVEKLVNRLDQEYALKWVQGLQNSTIRRVAAVFNHWPSETKSEVVAHLMGREISDELLMTVAGAVDSLFYVKVRAGERVIIKLSDEDKAVIKRATDVVASKEITSAVKKFTNSSLKPSLTVLYMNVKLWEHLTSNGIDKKIYRDALQEISAIATSEEEENISVLIDLLISLLSRPYKFVRTVVYFVFVSLLPNIKYSEIEHIIDSLIMDDSEIEAEEGISDTENDDIDSNEEENDEIFEEETEEENDDADDETVDPKLISRLEQALGNAAVKRNEDGGFDSDASLSDMDDDTMFAMDEKLADVFKAMNPQKTKVQKSHALQDFRSKVTDLLLFTVSSTETPNDVKLELIVPLLQLCIVQLKRKAESTVSKRNIELLEMLSKQKKITTSETKILEILDSLVEQAANVSNPLLNAPIASLTSFVFSLGIIANEVSPAIKTAFMDVFNKFLTQEEGQLSSELASAAIVKYPQHFVSELSIFVNAGFNEDLRIIRRMEALQCIVSLLNKAVVKISPLEKSSVKELAKKCADYLNSVVSSPSEVKPRFFATVLKVVYTAACNLNDKPKGYLEKYVSPVLEVMAENGELWKSLKKCNSSSMQICGKQPVHVVKAAFKQLS